MQMRRSTMRRLQHSLTFVVILAFLLTAQLRVGTYSKGATNGDVVATSAGDGKAGSSHGGGGGGGGVYGFLVHAALVLSASLLGVLLCYRCGLADIDMQVVLICTTIQDSE